MIVDVILCGLLFYLTFPLLTGYCAHHYGRSFKTWFVIGCFLPVISFFIISGLVFWNEKTTPKHKLSKREIKESNDLVQDLVENTGVSKNFSRKRKAPILK